MNWEFKGDVALVNQPQSSNTNSANYRDRFVANISGSSSNLNLIFTGKNSSFGLNYFADGRHSYTASASRKTGGWNLNGSLIIDQDSVAEDANVSDRSSVQATHKSGLRLNFNRTNILRNIDGSSSVNTGEIGFITKNKEHNRTFNGSLLFKERFNNKNPNATRILNLAKVHFHKLTTQNFYNRNCYKKQKQY